MNTFDAGSFSNDSMAMNQYQILAHDTDQNKDKGLEALPFLLLGLFGEVGTLLSALKKKQRDRDSYVGYAEIVNEEFGDTLWYFSNITSRVSLNLSVLAQRVFRQLDDWDQTEVHDFGTFGDVQSKKDPSGSATSEKFENSVINLAGKVGVLLNDYSLDKISGNRDLLSSHLVEIFRAIIDAADIADVSLDQVAISNVRKIYSRWPVTKEYIPPFDKGLDVNEQLPRKIEMHIMERQTGSRTYVIQQCNGINIGSKLTDNKMQEDDYRFHDVFHLAYVAILGWSPVIRALFKLKRKSLPKVDEAEDGARAILIDEGVSTSIFNHALRLNYFESIASLDYPLLKFVHEFVRGFEVERCPLWQWEEAILEGYRVFRELRKHRKGIITADLNNRKITFAPLV